MVRMRVVVFGRMKARAMLWVRVDWGLTFDTVRGVNMSKPAILPMLSIKIDFLIFCMNYSLKILHGILNILVATRRLDGRVRGVGEGEDDGEGSRTG